MSVLYYIIKYLPRNLLSYYVGRFFRIRFPRLLALVFNRLFVALLRIDMKEAEKSLEGYQTIEDIFTRRLRKGQRTLHPDFCSPCDGYLTYVQPVVSDRDALQVKGSWYSLSHLLFGSKDKASENAFIPAWYSTIYLAPHNYHRVHSPVSGELTKISYIPGDLWPVNPGFLTKIPALFCSNERLIFEIKTPSYGRIYVAMIGAMNVGRIKTEFAKDLITNMKDRIQYYNDLTITVKTINQKIDQGDELGTFMLGSTTIIVGEKGFQVPVSLDKKDCYHPIKLGSSFQC